MPRAFSVFGLATIASGFVLFALSSKAVRRGREQPAPGPVLGGTGSWNEREVVGGTGGSAVPAGPLGGLGHRGRHMQRCPS